MGSLLARRRTGLWLPIVVVIIGCSTGPFDMVRISGTVKFDDGRPVSSEAFRMKLVPIDVPASGGAHPRGATAKVEADGSFTVVTTLTYDDGLIAGKHRVYLPLGPEAGVPPVYSDPSNSPLVIDTSEGKHFDLVIPTTPPAS